MIILIELENLNPTLICFMKIILVLKGNKIISSDKQKAINQLVSKYFSIISMK
ncbi:MAG: hypothetical protein CM1200mP1_14330 [Candidatus Neomarinimicrobiota bacterium]|nr:MAG: hypothetical protein CM1200mP1_14330 [Candidatus Neomarinimicrobiota bacterium]